MTFDWLKDLRSQSVRSTRRRNVRRCSISTQTLETRALLSGDPLMTMGDDASGHDHGSHDHGGDASADLPHADNPTKQTEHLAAMKLADPALATNTVVASGDWSDPAIWSNGTLPADGARIVIPADMTVTVDAVIPTTYKTVRIEGTLRFATDVDTELRVDTIVGTPISRFEMGTVGTPIEDGVTARIVVADTGEIDRTWDPHGLSRGLILHGSSSIHGAAKSSFSTTSVAPREGDMTLTLSDVPTNWDVGDTLVIAGTKADATGEEVVTITSIDGNTITLDQALVHDHIPPRSDFAVHVANTTRNAVIESENPALDRRGHLMFMHSRDVNVAYGGFYQLGRTNKLEELNNAEIDEHGMLAEGTGTNPAGRYSVHFHRNGVTAAGGSSKVTGSAVVGSPGWGYVNHSSYVDFTDNVSFDVNGAAFNTEAGDEIGSFVGNLSIKTHGTSEHPTERQGEQDFGHAGDGFWFQGAGVTIDSNVATGATGSGLILYNDALIQEGLGRTEFLAENLPDPSVANGAETVPVVLVPIKSFKGNTAYGSVVGAQTYYHRTHIQLDDDQIPQAADLQGKFADSVLEDLTVWNSGTGFSASYTLDAQFKNFTIVNSLDDAGEVGFTAGNAYNRAGHRYENFDVEGFVTGLIPSRSGVVTIDGGHFNNANDIVIKETRQTHRRLEVTGDVQFGDLEGLQFEDEFEPRENIVMLANLGSLADSSDQWFLLNDRVILNFGEYSGEQLFFPQQAGDFVLYQSEPPQIDPTDPGPGVDDQFIGLTNSQLQGQFGSSFGGTVASTDAVDAPGDGVIGMIGSATEDPGVLPDPDDPFVVTQEEIDDLAERVRELRGLSSEQVDLMFAGLGESIDATSLRAFVDQVQALDDSAIESHISGLSLGDHIMAAQGIDALFEVIEDGDDEDDEPGDEEDTGDEDEECPDGEHEDEGESDEDGDISEDEDESDEDGDLGEDDDESDEDGDFGEDDEESDEDGDFGDDEEESDEDGDLGEDDDESDEDGDFGEDDDESDEDGDLGEDEDESDEDGDLGEDEEESDEDGDFVDDEEESDEEGDLGGDNEESDEDGDVSEDDDESDEDGDIGEDDEETDEDDETTDEDGDVGEDDEESGEDDDVGEDGEESDEDGDFGEDDEESDGDGDSGEDEDEFGEDETGEQLDGDILDIDGDGGFDFSRDGIALLAYAFGARGEQLALFLPDGTAQSATTLESKLQQSLNALDLDGDGEFQFASDGIVLLAYAFGARGDQLEAFRSNKATRDGATITRRLDSMHSRKAASSTPVARRQSPDAVTWNLPDTSGAAAVVSAFSIDPIETESSNSHPAQGEPLASIEESDVRQATESVVGVEPTPADEVFSIPDRVAGLLSEM